MNIKDRIYGEIIINDKVIIDLINDPLFLRLKNISQDGAPHFIQPIRTVNRYEHSLGVYYLSKYFNRGLEEQISCLLHDISHTAFSHVVDFVMSNSKHEYADEMLNDVILKSNIPNIINKYGLDLDKILNIKKYPLLENALPDLSFDRLDYFLRDGFTAKFLPLEVINLILTNLKVVNNILCFKDLSIASLTAILFQNFSRLLWLDPTSHGAFFLLSKAIKEGLREGIINNSDLLLDDNELLIKLRKSKNAIVKNYLSRLKLGREFEYASKQEAEFYGPNKPRTINPYVNTDNGLKRLTDLTISLEYAFKEFKENYSYLGVKQVR